MNFNEARNKIVLKWLIGLVLALPAFISTVISIFKLLYFRLDDGSQMGGMISKPFKQIVYWIYEQTQFLNFFWINSPTPNQMEPVNIENAIFLFIYVLLFVGMAFIGSGHKLNRRLQIINRKIEDQLIEEAIKGSAGRTREQIEHSTMIPSSSIFNQVHQLYIAPIITAVVVAIVLKLVGI